MPWISCGHACPPEGMRVLVQFRGPHTRVPKEGYAKRKGMWWVLEDSGYRDPVNLINQDHWCGTNSQARLIARVRSHPNEPIFL